MIPATSIQQGIDQPFYGSNIYGRVVYGSAYPAIPIQQVGWPEFFQALIDYIVSCNVVGPGSAFFAIDPDSEIQWPATPPPFAMIEPGAFSHDEADIGGGRFCKLWRVQIDIHLIIGSSYDSAYQDTAVVSSASIKFGAYSLVHLLVNSMEQAYIVTPSGNYATIEMPIATNIGKPRRFKDSIQYISIPVTFEMTVQEILPSTLYATAMPPSINP